MKKAGLILNSVGFCCEFDAELIYGQAQVSIDLILSYAAIRLKFRLPRSSASKSRCFFLSSAFESVAVSISCRFLT